jgi:hypothetical protein
VIAERRDGDLREAGQQHPQARLGEAVVVVRVAVHRPDERRRAEERPAGPEHAPRLLDRDPWLGEVLEDLEHRHDVQGLVREREPKRVADDVGSVSG